MRLASGSFEAERIYELVYVAKDRVVAGLGLVGVRDLVPHLKRDAGAIQPVERAYSIGISRSGRFPRHLLHDGFNEDERARRSPPVTIRGPVLHLRADT